MKLSSSAIVVSVLAAACGSPAPARVIDRGATAQPSSDTVWTATRCDQLDSAGSCALYGVSIYELLARPERFHGARVRLKGYVNFEFEGNAFCHDQAVWERGLTRECLWIEPPEIPASIKGRPRWNRRDAIVEATFDGLQRGHLGMFSGALVHVTRLDPSGGPPIRADERPKPGQ